MDIKFTCPRCGQNISIDEKGAGATVECPTCKSQISVPLEPRLSSRAVAFYHALESSEPAIERRSGWSWFLKIVGVICLVGGFFVAVMSEERSDSARFIYIVIGIGGAIQSFVFAFLIDVFTDIRWYLKKLVDARNA